MNTNMSQRPPSLQMNNNMSQRAPSLQMNNNMSQRAPSLQMNTNMKTGCKTTSESDLESQRFILGCQFREEKLTLKERHYPRLKNVITPD